MCNCILESVGFCSTKPSIAWDAEEAEFSKALFAFLGKVEEMCHRCIWCVETADDSRQDRSFSLVHFSICACLALL